MIINIIKQQCMLYKSLTLSLSFLSLVTLGLAECHCKKMNYFKCKICYCSEGQQFQCSLSSPEGNDEQYYEKETCFSHCCGEIIPEEMGMLAIQKCMEINEERKREDLTKIVLCIILGIFMITFGLIVYLKSNRQQNNIFGSNCSEENLRQISHQELNQAQLNKDQVCSICLQQCVQILTTCQHVFHFQCLIAWLQKNSVCPNCATPQISLVKYHCFRCCKLFVLVNIRNSHAVEKFRQKIYGKQCSSCIQ